MPTMTQTLAVNFPRARVWPLLGDVEQVMSCMPGASLTKPREGDRIFGQMRVKLGPIAATFAGEGTLTMDEATHTGVIHGQGTDPKNNSRAKADVTFAVVEEGAGTRIDLTVDFTLTGVLAQFSRGAIVQEIANRLTAEFARNLEAKLAATAPVAEVAASSDAVAAPAPEPASKPAPEPAKELNAGNLLWSMVKDWLRKLFSNPLPSGERVARRAGEGDARGGASGKSATPSP
ncbi:carbon monoxide dehydrogenase subunit G [Azospirillum brasilense]|uniref:Carbon monoxide dehydrogenase subunit G n=1 Tax=Azospirillum brasilense TaxID=192 RepID=A0A560BMB6_AZOBR|nr:SRPBCC family protein [Azospirillum brasilense]TWA73751.1 carbon monoxide dehydrogenase subunit G [Azospirillum brasilense]